MRLVKLTAFPAIAATCAVLGFVIAEGAGLEPLTYGAPRNIAEAAGLGSAADVWRLADAGDEATRVYPVRREIISSAVPYATALEAAVWSRRVQLVQLLNDRGMLPPAERDRLTCLARELHSSDIEDYLAGGRQVACNESVVAQVTARPSAGGGR